MNLTTFTMIFIFSYGIVFLNFALCIIHIRNKRYIHFISALLLADFGLMCVAGGISVHYLYQGSLVKLLVCIPMALLSPIGSLFALECFGSRKNARSLVTVVFAGTILVLGFCLFCIASNLPWRLIFTIVYAWLAVTFLAIAVYEARDLSPLSSLTRGLAVFYFSVCLGIALPFMMSVFQYFDFYPALNILWIFQIISVLIVTLIAFRSPDTYRLIEAQASKIRYGNSRLSNPERSRISGLLASLMNEKQLYLDTDLNLVSLAKKLDISTHQLSEFINTEYRQGFSDYVNGFRVEAAKTFLVDRKDLSIIEIVFECGFNSKSTFNLVFRKLAGCTPREYRLRR